MAGEKISPITRISSSSDKPIELGSLFENVYLDYYDENNKTQLKNYTLKDLYNELKDYFSQGSFILTSSSEPTINEPQIKIWLDTTAHSWTELNEVKDT